MTTQALTFIAGGSKGLGAALTNAFETKGHEVFDFSRTGEGEHHIACDFAKADDANQIFEATFKQAASRPDIKEINLIVNTAVLKPFGSLTKTQSGEVAQHLTINVTATMYLLRAFILNFQDHSARKTIVYVSSGAARRDIPGLAMYSASKAFFERFIDTTATEQKACEHPISCMTINPGVMDTGMQVEIRAQDQQDFPMVDMWNELHQKGQLAAPEDIAAVFVKLMASEATNGGYYTAQEHL
ncbi:SDR family NAD(P)-dependent oxidoreductase [Marinicella sp. S1101]|uniref:SDR family NAD(P)-dependent oxidoreductase n=1 Tax=Marinicella marina TaxID=2996016 RepID=UPI002260F41D|nr:SDR family NAD(P)-dependent oxidoreductase [Marinicella marina]MCX7554028.1 SDR family NAD(P)-dependent oxidoreductase [Marinicella marina]MDJ1140520.1 SDR family NAD(P)-dependent oxidoreductase [Marinicella marina]